MALIIEDGTIVAGANSFTTDVEFVAYALARSITLPATEAERDVLQIKAVDYIVSVEGRLKGCRTSPKLQDLPYPRIGSCIYGETIDSDEIVQSLKNAQMELGIQVQDSDILISEQSQNVAREKLDTLEVEYFSGGSWSQVRTDKADAYLKPLMINNGNDNLMARV